MKDVLLTLALILITGIAVLLCFSSIYLASKSDEYWEEIKRRLGKNDERH